MFSIWSSGRWDCQDLLHREKDDLDAMHWAAEEMTEEHIDTKNNRVSDCRSKTVQVLPIAVAIMPVFQLNESLSPKSSSHSRKGER